MGLHDWHIQKEQDGKSPLAKNQSVCVNWWGDMCIHYALKTPYKSL